MILATAFVLHAVRTALSHAAFHEEHLALLNEGTPVPVIFRFATAKPVARRDGIRIEIRFFFTSPKFGVWRLKPSEALQYAFWLVSGNEGSPSDWLQTAQEVTHHA